MPNLDRTGPNGEGPRTGRGLGNCIDESSFNNGMRGRCCRNFNRNFSQKRMNRMGRAGRSNQN